MGFGVRQAVPGSFLGGETVAGGSSGHCATAPSSHASSVQSIAVGSIGAYRDAVAGRPGTRPDVDAAASARASDVNAVGLAGYGIRPTACQACSDSRAVDTRCAGAA